MSWSNVNTEQRFTHEDIAQYLSRCGQPRMAAAVREFEAKAIVLSRQYHDLLDEVTRLRLQIHPQAPTGDRVSYKSEWD